MRPDEPIDRDTNDPEAGETSQPEEIDKEREISRLESRITAIRQEVMDLRQAEAAAGERSARQIKELRILWRDKLITDEKQFATLSERISVAESSVHEHLRRDLKVKYAEYREARVALLSRTVQADALRTMALDLRIRDRLSELQPSDVSAEDMSADAVFELKGKNLIVVKKPPAAYEYVAALPFVMQGVLSERVSRVLDVFQEGGATYLVIEKAAGTPVDRMAPDAIAEITQAHYNQLVEDVRDLNARGLKIYPSAKSNQSYDPTKGFLFFDIADQEAEFPLTEAPEQVKEEFLRPSLIGGERNHVVTQKLQTAIGEMWDN